LPSDPDSDDALGLFAYNIDLAVKVQPLRHEVTKKIEIYYNLPGIFFSIIELSSFEVE
jgi:hypothetical protein